MFDPSKARYAAFERCLTDAQMKTIRREIIDANPVSYTHLTLPTKA